MHNGLTCSPCVNEVTCSTQEGLVTILKTKRARLKAQIDELDIALNALEKNPEIANILELTTKALR